MIISHFPPSPYITQVRQELIHNLDSGHRYVGYDAYSAGSVFGLILVCCVPSLPFEIRMFIWPHCILEIFILGFLLLK